MNYSLYNYANATHWRKESETRFVLTKQCTPVLTVDDDAIHGMWVVRASGGTYQVSKADAPTYADAVDRVSAKIAKDAAAHLSLLRLALKDGDLGEKEVRKAAVDVFADVVA